MFSYQIKKYHEFALGELKQLRNSVAVLFEFEEKYQISMHNLSMQVLFDFQ